MITWGDKLQAISKAKLESLAAAEFDKKRVYQICADRAEQGFSWAEIRQSISIGVQGCEAVKSLLADLAKQKVRVEWIPVQEGPDIKFSILRISWGSRL